MPAPTLRELAPAGLDIDEDPYPLYAALRDRGPVHRITVPGTGEVWLVVARDEARAALTDARLSTDVRYSSSSTDDGGYAIGRNMLQADPPEHTRLRALVAREFTGGRIADMRPYIESVAGALVDALPADGEADLVQEYALPLPITVICAMLGVPESDHADFHAWSTELVTPTSPQAAAGAATAMTGYLAAFIASRRAEPADDLMSALVGTSAAGEGVLSAEELLGMAFLLLVAGHETTVNLISATLHSLLRHPGQLDLVRADPALIEGAVEESLRFNSPVAAAAFRFAAEPLEIGGTAVPAGDSVQISLAAASRDPGHFPKPDLFDVRREARGHLGFGHGIHHCLGAPLARAEAAVALRILLERRPVLGFAADPDALTWRTGTMLRGLARLPVRLGGPGAAG
ncbi:cytochrome P450 family protein [Streptomyces sp. CA-111067]|uniref:cytochrome P450 family protein n=1 Tax=Streptomyces sp. CA-111067 TaxID=3240046 RepID=UPI003D966AA0